MQLAKKCGADITGNTITKKTNLLVVGEQAGSKLKKAVDLGIEIMDMNDFVEVTSGIEIDSNCPISTSPTLTTLSQVFSNEFISFVPMKESLSERLTTLIMQHGGKANSKLCKSTTMLVYQLPPIPQRRGFCFNKKCKKTRHSNSIPRPIQ